MSAKIRLQQAKDKAAIDGLMAASFGDGRFHRSVRHLRPGSAITELCFVIEQDDIMIGSLRYWPVIIAGHICLLLGPLAIEPVYKGQGYGKQLVSHSLTIAETLSYPLVLVSGEPDYYPRFGFVPASGDEFLWPGFVEAERLQIKWLAADKATFPKGIKAILPI